MKKILLVITAVCSVLFFAGCASTVRVDVTRPAELDLRGAKTVAVLPFRPVSSWSGSYSYRMGQRVSVLDFLSFVFESPSSDEERCLYELKNQLEKKILDSGYLTLISSNIVEKELDRGDAVSADVYLVGQVTRFDVVDREKERRSSKDGEVYYYKEYTREVNFDFYCQIIDSQSNTVLGYKKFAYSRSSYDEEKKSKLPSAYNIIESSISYAVSDLMRSLEPYKITKNIKLLSHKSEEMKNADKMVKSGLITEGGRTFLKIYNNTGIFEAGYNAALLLEALGKYDSAEELMEDVAKKSGEKKAYTALQDIRNEKQLNQKLLDQQALHDGEKKSRKTESDEWMSDFDDAPTKLNFDDIVW